MPEIVIEMIKRERDEALAEVERLKVQASNYAYQRDAARQERDQAVREAKWLREDVDRLDQVLRIAGRQRDSARAQVHLAHSGRYDDCLRKPCIDWRARDADFRANDQDPAAETSVEPCPAVSPGLCSNVSFYGRRCVLTDHGWQQPCHFERDAEEDYDLTKGTTLKDLLEALTAGGWVAVSAAMRWVEYRMYRDAAEAERLFGADHPVTRGKRQATHAAQDEREIVVRYLSDRAEARHV